MFPAADPNDGLIDLAIFTSMGRTEALKVRNTVSGEGASTVSIVLS